MVGWAEVLCTAVAGVWQRGRRRCMGRLGCGVWGVAFGVWRLAFGVWRLGCGVWGVAWRLGCGV
eukprot:355027-Chlamydomonas_euryale.AAC.7